MVDTLETVSRERGFASWHAVQEAGRVESGAFKEAGQEAAQGAPGRQCGSGLERIVAQGSSGGEFTLNDAQFVVARE
ncbi:MAG TPA: hypothetical protein EYG11_25055 [Candidatus Latescibacteria bacterium]|nr:hypothetical protein [Candidatus Handelsmanbacteria bacterium]HIL11969.1 hypothetical protein [Candidatus Latescibacterota bacterium]